MAKSELSIVFDDKSKLEAAVAAIKQEEDFKKRSTSKVIKNGKELIIKIEGSDIVSVRATLNSYLRDLQLIENVDRIE